VLHKNILNKMELNIDKISVTDENKVRYVFVIKGNIIYLEKTNLGEDILISETEFERDMKMLQEIKTILKL
tara:strand:- start:1720 stop:1932 length:213 start_codon:yes stop_codon:yes gene_type:complete